MERLGESRSEAPLMYNYVVPKGIKKLANAHPATLQDLPERLVELEAELHRHEARDAKARPLKSIKSVAPGDINKQTVIEYTQGDNQFAAGHSDVTYAGSNHARGVRQIKFYAEEQLVLAIEGDFEDQQFGSNFRFKNVLQYVTGPWEKDFIKLTDALREFTAKRRAAFNQRRAALHAKR
jgi:hypothetical protein